jgi:DNA excision repair protein ERCC-4
LFSKRFIFFVHFLLISVAQSFLNTLFAVKLVREENQTAFLKAFSDVPEGFTREISHIDRVLKDLFLQEIHLCHRSDTSVDASLTMSHQPITFQVTPPITKAMQDIQINIIELLKKGLLHLKRLPLVDLSELNLDECCFKRGWDAVLYRLLEPVWGQLSRRYKQMIQVTKVYLFD